MTVVYGVTGGVRKSYIVINDLKDILLTTREQPPVSKNVKKNHLYLLTRVYHDLQASQDFKRMIATLKSQCFVFYVFKYSVIIFRSIFKQPFTVQLAFMQYKFKGKEHDITLLPHKNSKGSTPYKRTYPSTMKRIKEVAGEHKPAAAFELVDKEMGGVVDMSIGKLPRSRNQICDARKKLFASDKADNRAIMMERCKCVAQGEVQFVRSVQAAPQPLCFVYRYPIKAGSVMLH